MYSKRMKWYQKFWRNSNGEIVIFQPPNLPIIVWAVFNVIGRIVTDGFIHHAATAISFAGLIIWAMLELLSGDTYFRRLLGLMILIATASKYIV